MQALDGLRRLVLHTRADEHLRDRGVQALIETGGEAARTILRQVIELDDCTYSRLRAALALTEQDDERARSLVANRVLGASDELVPCMIDDPEVGGHPRLEALYALIGADDPRAFPALLATLRALALPAGGKVIDPDNAQFAMAWLWSLSDGVEALRYPAGSAG